MKGKSWKKRKIAWFLSAYVLLAVPAVAFSAHWLIGRIRTVSDGVQEAALDDRLEREKISELDSMRSLSDRIAGNGEALDGIIDESQEVSLIKELERLASDAGVDIRIAADDQAADAAAKSKKKKDDDDKTIADSLAHQKNVTVTITITGSYGRSADFIRRLENGSHWINVIALEMRKKSDSPDSDIRSEGGMFFASPSSSGTPDQASPARSQAEEKLVSSLKAVIYLK